MRTVTDRPSQPNPADYGRRIRRKPPEPPNDGDCWYRGCLRYGRSVRIIPGVARVLCAAHLALIEDAIASRGPEAVNWGRTSEQLRAEWQAKIADLGQRLASLGPRPDDDDPWDDTAWEAQRRWRELEGAIAELNERIERLRDRPDHPFVVVRTLTGRTR